MNRTHQATHIARTTDPIVISMAEWVQTQIPDALFFTGTDNVLPILDAIEQELARDTFLALDPPMVEYLGLRRDGLAARQAPVRFGGEFLDRLPGFVSAEMTEVLQLRSEVADSLIGLRAGIVDLSNDIPVGLPDAEFRTEVSRLYATKVAPAVAELQHDIAANTFSNALVERTLTPGRLVRMAAEAGACLGLGAVSQPTASRAVVGAAIVGAAEVADLFLGAASDVGKGDESAQRNPMYVFAVASTQQASPGKKRRRRH